MYLKMYRNKADIKAHKKSTLLRNDDGKGRQKDCPTPVASGAGYIVLHFLFRDRSIVVYSLLVIFGLCLVSVLFSGVSLLEVLQKLPLVAVKFALVQ